MIQDLQKNLTITLIFLPIILIIISLAILIKKVDKKLSKYRNYWLISAIIFGSFFIYAAFTNQLSNINFFLGAGTLTSMIASYRKLTIKK
jgi:hypothetical protein